MTDGDSAARRRIDRVMRSGQSTWYQAQKPVMQSDIFDDSNCATGLERQASLQKRGLNDF
jgi:hypothetical protein